jgi:hypothetical protein
MDVVLAETSRPGPEPCWRKTQRAANLRPLLRLVPSPRYLPKFDLGYCSAGTVAGQGAVMAPVEERTTASSNEQK